MKRPIKEILEDCTDLLEQWIDGDAPRVDTKILLEEIYTRSIKSGARPLDHNLTARYETAKQLVIKGKKIGEACRMAGITLDQWYRRKKIEKRERNND